MTKSKALNGYHWWSVHPQGHREYIHIMDLVLTNATTERATSCSMFGVCFRLFGIRSPKPSIISVPASLNSYTFTCVLYVSGLTVYRKHFFVVVVCCCCFYIVAGTHLPASVLMIAIKHALSKLPIACIHPTPHPHPDLLLNKMKKITLVGNKNSNSFSQIVYTTIVQCPRIFVSFCGKPQLSKANKSDRHLIT